MVSVTFFPGIGFLKRVWFSQVFNVFQWIWLLSHSFWHHRDLIILLGRLDVLAFAWIMEKNKKLTDTGLFGLFWNLDCYKSFVGFGFCLD
ncbi:MAG: hypothetical protein ABIR81_08885 [Ginsengibacter sp.]